MYELDTPSEESKGNEGEAEIVLAHVKDLLAAGLREGDIAIIAPYHLQVRRRELFLIIKIILINKNNKIIINFLFLIILGED